MNPPVKAFGKHAPTPQGFEEHELICLSMSRSQFNPVKPLK